MWNEENAEKRTCLQQIFEVTEKITKNVCVDNAKQDCNVLLHLRKRKQNFSLQIPPYLVSYVYVIEFKEIAWTVAQNYSISIWHSYFSSFSIHFYLFIDVSFSYKNRHALAYLMFLWKSRPGIWLTSILTVIGA